MIRGPGVHVAPSGLGSERDQWRAVGCSAPTRMVNENRVPSGDHARFEGLSVSRVTCDTAPSASIQRTKIWVFPSPSGARKASRLPSGDQRGEDPSRR